MVATTRQAASRRKKTSRKSKTVKLKTKRRKGNMKRAAKKLLSTTPKRGELLLDLGRELVRATMDCRPSKRNRSPYVADVKILSEENRTAIAHVPNLDMGGKCVSGTEMLVKPARNRKGVLVGANTLGKYGTPKCEFHTQLIKVKECENVHLNNGKGVIVGAHPSLGEKIARSLLEKNLFSELTPITEVSSQVSNICGCDMRTDFVLTHSDGSRSVVEVKQVVDTDYNFQTPPPSRSKCVYFQKDRSKRYERCGIFPWGNSKQKGPEGEHVVSARAIKHVRELTKIAKGLATDEEGKKLKASVLFIVNREDALVFRANDEACPSFARYLKEASEAGVTVLARRIIWGTDDGEVGKAFDGGPCKVNYV